MHQEWNKYNSNDDDDDDDNNNNNSSDALMQQSIKSKVYCDTIELFSRHKGGIWSRHDSLDVFRDDGSSFLSSELQPV